MSDKSDLKAELERKKQRLAQIREEKKRKEEERKKKEVRKKVSKDAELALILYHTLVLFVCSIAFCQAVTHKRLRLCVSMRAYKHLCVCRRLVLEFLIKMCMHMHFYFVFNSIWVICESDLYLTIRRWHSLYILWSPRASRRQRWPQRIQTWIESGGRLRPCYRVLASHQSLH